MATVWWVFRATFPDKHPLLFKPINLQATGNYACQNRQTWRTVEKQNLPT